MNNLGRIVVCVVLLLPVVAWVAAGDHAGHEPEAETPAGDVAAALPEELRDLLNKEMRLIDSGIGRIGSAIAAGDWETVAETASKIETSFILKQSLSQDQLDILHGVLPSQFIEWDVAFHGRAGDLSHAAHLENPEIAVHHLSRMVEACVSCHAAYAPARFPGLVQETEETHQH